MPWFSDLTHCASVFNILDPLVSVLACRMGFDVYARSGPRISTTSMTRAHRWPNRSTATRRLSSSSGLQIPLSKLFLILVHRRLRSLLVRPERWLETTTQLIASSPTLHTVNKKWDHTEKGQTILDPTTSSRNVASSSAVHLFAVLRLTVCLFSLWWSISLAKHVWCIAGDQGGCLCKMNCSVPQELDGFK